MTKFVKVYLGIGVVLGCISAHDTFKQKPELLNRKMLVTELAQAFAFVALEWPFIMIDAVRDAHKKHKEGQTNESES